MQINPLKKNNKKLEIFILRFFEVFLFFFTFSIKKIQYFIWAKEKNTITDARLIRTLRFQGSAHPAKNKFD